MKIEGVQSNFIEWPKTTIRPSIKWVQDGALKWHGSDRGVLQDKYLSQLTFYDTIENIKNIRDIFFVDSATTLTLSDFMQGQEIFGPEVDYSGDLLSVVENFGTRVFSGRNQMASMTVILRGIGLTFLGTTVSDLSNLNIQESWDGDLERFFNNNFTYNQFENTTLHKTKMKLVGEFEHNISDSKAILSKLLTTVRANEINLPLFEGSELAFVDTGHPRKVTLRNIELTRKYIDRWQFKIEFNETLPGNTP